MLKETKNYLRFQLSGATRFEVDPAGFMMMNDHQISSINLVNEIKKIPDLQYTTREEDGYYRKHHYVLVTNEIGDLIELYLGLDHSYADMELAEFVQRTMIKDASAPS